MKNKSLIKKIFIVLMLIITSASLDLKNAKVVLDKILSLDSIVIRISHKIDEESLNRFSKVIEI